MKIYVFGAGASHSAHNKKLESYQIPPLTKDILAGINKYHIYAKEIGMTLNDRDEFEDDTVEFINKDTNTINFEAWLTTKWQEANAKKSGLHRDAALRRLAKLAFFIWIILLRVSECVYLDENNCRGSNMYRMLLKKFSNKSEDFGIINFNYDLLLDFAFKDIFGKTFQNIGDYIESNYIKPHGSINWFLDKRQEDRILNYENKHDFDTKVRIETAIENMYKDVSLKFDGHKVFEPDDRNLYKIDNILREFSSQYFYPLIFLPLTIKDYELVTGFEKQIIDAGKNLFKQATEVYLIGYRANDKIILDLFDNMTSSNIKLHIVNTNQASAEKIRNQMLQKFPKKLIAGDIYSKGFPDFVQNF